MYNKRLDERIKRKDFVIDHGLLDLERQTEVDKTSKEAKSIRRKLAQFERFHSASDHDELIDTILKIRELKRRIGNLEELSDYTNFEEIEVYLFSNKKHMLGKRKHLTHDSRAKKSIGKILGTLESRVDMVVRIFTCRRQAATDTLK